MSGLAQRLTQAWLTRGPIAWALSPIALLLWLLVSVRRWAYAKGWIRSHRLPRPVIVVGNRIAGGAGKTPTTIAILQHLQARGLRPGVLTRGYKAQNSSEFGGVLLDELSAHKLDALTTGDEPMLIWRRTGAPTLIDRDRAKGGDKLLQAHPEIDVLVCDDGLQHLQLQRDIEIVVFDARGQGNGWLLPAGPLREPISVTPTCNLSAPPIVLYNAAQPSTALPGFVSRTHTKPLQTLQSWWSGAASSESLDPQDTPEVHALAGIAQPQRFFDALTQMGYRVQGIPLDDHADLRDLPWPLACRHLVVTEKDAVKLDPRHVAQARPHTTVWVAALDFTPETRFWHELDAALDRAQRVRRQH